MEENKQILLVEDNRELNEINRRALVLRGYTVLAALTLDEARKLLSEHEPEVILLDVVLPDGSGFDFCEEIREKTDAHILYLTSKTEHEDKVKGLLRGGDDYITKPYHLEEMLARVAAAMRRRRMEAVKPPIKIISKGPLTLDTVAVQAFLNGKDILLTPKEFALLLQLVQNEGQVLTKETLYEAVWRAPLNDDSSSLWRHVSSVKRRLEESGGEVSLVNVRGEGYMLLIKN